MTALRTTRWFSSYTTSLDVNAIVAASFATSNRVAATHPITSSSAAAEVVGDPGQPLALGAAPNCSIDAAATPPDDHGRPADFGPSQASPAGQVPTASQVTAFARRIAGMFGRTAAAPPDTAVAAQEMSFSAFRTLAGWPDNPTINPQRCVWVLTVHAPMAVKVPPGAAARTVDVYSVVVDVASGTMIGLLAGSDLVR